MDIDIYWTTLLILLPTVLLLAGRNLLTRSFLHTYERWGRLRRWRRAHEVQEKPEQTSTLLADCHTPPPQNLSRHDKVSSFRYTFLSIYLVVMSPEWFSGPYLWALLREEKGLAESMVVALYATAYTSAAISALIVGFLADRFGRRKACLAQCAIHSAACLTVIFGGTCLPILFLGRVLAGMALTLLWTVFESWMVTEWNARGLEEEGGGGLSEMFAMMTTWNCASAILGGVFCHCMVSVLGSKLWPFGTGIVLQAVAVVLIFRNMNENYGLPDVDSGEAGSAGRLEVAGRGRLGDSRIWALSLVTCCFEGTTFLVVFFWPSVLQAAHRQVSLDTDDDIPYGVISASLMASMIIGALLFNVSSASKRSVCGVGANAKRPVCLLLSAVSIAGLSMVLLSMSRNEATQLTTFLIFELANGVYTPSMAYIRGLVVNNKGRTGLYGLMKIPLFIFVILALGVTAEDNRSKRYIFASASLCLVLAVIGLVCGFFETLKPPGNPTSLLEHEQETEEIQGPSHKTSEILMDEKDESATWGHEA
ncbi:hypothetical protein N0V82_003807 [Gnomoniopsis sp. IMI 355080]|nr:hypothetical protein N0V82_003807 [Gnomoniopsis sp. IMI 355080]